MDVATAVQSFAAGSGALLGLLAYLRSGKTEDRAARQSEVNDLWDENRALGADNRLLWDEIRRVRRESAGEIAALRDEHQGQLNYLRDQHEAEMSEMRRRHQDCERQLAALRRGAS